jgi:hypothetical protein
VAEVDVEVAEVEVVAAVVVVVVAVVAAVVVAAVAETDEVLGLACVHARTYSTSNGWDSLKDPSEGGRPIQSARQASE